MSHELHSGTARATVIASVRQGDVMSVVQRIVMVMFLFSHPWDGYAQRLEPAGPADFATKQAAWEQHQQLEQDSMFKGLNWRDVGPVVQGGRIVDIEVVPDQPYTFYAAYASGGLWKTTNNGVSFTPLFDDMPTMIMGDIAIDPNQPETIWVGTGEANSSRSSYGGIGLFRSTDAGANWQHMGLEETDRIGRILIDPRNSNRIIVAALGKLYSSGGQRGVFVSNDGGQTWLNTLPSSKWSGAIDLIMNPNNPDIIYASTWDRKRTPWEFSEGGNDSGVWRSTDAGNTWARLDTRNGSGLPSGGYVGRIALAIAPSQPQTLYAAVDNQEPLPESEWDLGDRPLSAKRLRHMTKSQFLGQSEDEIEVFIRSNDLPIDIDAARLIEMIETDEMSVRDLLDELGDANANLFNTDIKGLEIYRSDDAGDSWYKTHEGPVAEVVYSYGYYFGQIRVAPDDADRIYVVGVPIITSADGGKTFDGSLNDPSVHVDYHAWWINPGNAQHMILGNDGGIDMTYDGGKSWIKLDAQPVGQFYAINVDMAKPYNVYGGLQDNGTYKGSSQGDWQQGPSWGRIFGGDGFQVAIDHDENQTYAGYQFGNYVRLGDGLPADVRPRDELDEEALRYNWMTPIILSPHNADVVYFGTNKLFRSLDEGDSWTAISGDLSKSKRRGDVPFATITTISESTEQFGRLWAGTDDGQVWMTPNGGNDWENVVNGLPKNRWVSRVEASKFDRQRAYVSLNGYRNDDTQAYLYRTDNAGAIWRDISNNLPAEAINVIKEDPINQNVLYVGTDRGVYVSLDRGEKWQVLGEGLPHVPVHDLVVHPRDRELVAGTHGRSIWILDVLPVQELTEQVQGEPLQVFYIDDVQASRSWRSRQSKWFSRPSDVEDVSVSFWSEDIGSGRFEVVDKNDNVLKVGQLDIIAGINRFGWNLLVDQDRALSAERDDNAGIDDLQAKDMPYQQSLSLGHPLYVMPGEYQVRVTMGDNSSSSELMVNAPEPFRSRVKSEPEVRGK